MRGSLSCEAPVKYGVLSVAAMRALQAVQRTGVAGERRQLSRKLVTRAYMEPCQPLPQAGAKPRWQPLLAAEIDDVQLAARRQPDQRLGERRPPFGDHRQAAGEEDAREA